MSKLLDHLNIESRRPTRIPKEILAMVPENTEHVLPVTEMEDINVSQPDNSEAFEVRKTDLDLNQHINNVRYIEWALSSLDNNGTNINTLDITFWQYRG